MHVIATLLALILAALLWPRGTRRGLMLLLSTALGLLALAAVIGLTAVAGHMVVRYWPTSGIILASVAVACLWAWAMNSTARQIDGWLDRAYARRHPRYELLWRAMDRAVARLEARGVNLTGPVDELQRVAWIGREQADERQAMAELARAMEAQRAQLGITSTTRNA